jgi:hypothetical protein
MRNETWCHCTTLHHATLQYVKICDAQTSARYLGGPINHLPRQGDKRRSHLHVWCGVVVWYNVIIYQTYALFMLINTTI